MAPQYRAASRTQKMLLLDTFVALTGSVRTYAMWLLNHPVESRPRILPARPVHFGPEVQQALYQAWRAANQICAKRLIPFLPTLVEALERHGHLHLTEKCRTPLLSISAATAGRLLRSQRKHGPRGLSTTQAGTLLKHQIPIRTFQRLNRNFADEGNTRAAKYVKTGENTWLLVEEDFTSKIPLLNLPEMEGLCLEEVVAEAQQMCITVATTVAQAPCPVCGVASSRVLWWLLRISVLK
jgi:hypothetical protein